MRHLLLFVLFSGLVTSTAIGQHSDSEIYPRQVSIDHNDAVKFFSSKYVSAFMNPSSSVDPQQLNSSSGNLAIVNLTGSENTAVLAQAGYGITGIIDISGKFSEARLDQQGADLLSVLNIKGDANQFDVTQQGKSLQNYFQVLGSGLDFDVIQTNKGIRLTQSGAGSIPFSIQQAGRPSPIIISNN